MKLCDALLQGVQCGGFVYNSVDAQADFPALERALLEVWDSEGLFRQTVEQRRKSPPYVFYDGPPFATGMPHYGHILVGSIKDAVLRYQTMCGHLVDRRFGWDCHGLPVEYEMEKELGISGKRQIEAYGVAQFNEACRSIVLRYSKEWRAIVRRSGRWVDFDNEYKTMDSDYMESIWWVVKQLWQRKLIHKGYYVLPYCPRCSTALSNHELNLGAYRNVDDPAITVRFRVDAAHSGGKSLWLLAWTTTPWTLVANQALAVGAEFNYLQIAVGDDHYIVAEELCDRFFNDAQVLRRYRGADLLDWGYEPLFPYFAKLKEQGCFKVLTSSHVTVTDGTGIVHIAPGFGEDDYHLLANLGLPIVLPLDAECRYNSEVPDYEGQFVKAADAAIIQRLKDEGKLWKREQINHSYPHCWRCEAPLIYRAVSSWFVDVQSVKEKMLAANNKITWVPEHLQQGRFGKWLENARDWAISRQRYWGNPLPIWECEQGHSYCIGSRQELEQLSGQRVDDLHKHFVDALSFPCPQCSSSMRRVPEVLDCWFESGAMPYAQNHYPFENQQYFEDNFPADFINESLDQTRGWFYTLVVLAAALFEQPPFRMAVVSGMILAADGKKMSKSARNYTDPVKLMDNFGADAMRLYLLSSPVMKAEPLRFNDDGVRTILRSTLLPLWNAYSFFVSHANSQGLKIVSGLDNLHNPLDQWIMSELEALRLKVATAMVGCDLLQATTPLLSFVDLLNNWYIRRSRRRFAALNQRSDKAEAFATLWMVLIELMQIAAAFAPFFSDIVYRNLRSAAMPASVHLCDFPHPQPQRRCCELEDKMALVRHAVTLGRSLRATYSIKNRQPLRCLHLVSRSEHERSILYEFQDIIAEELNVKNVLIRADENELVHYEAKANFKLLGKLLGADMKAAAAKIASLTSNEIAPLLDGRTLSLEFDGKLQQQIELTAEKVDIRRSERPGLKVLNEGALTLGFDMELSEELVQEGWARDLIRQVQQERKSLGLQAGEEARLLLHANAIVQAALLEYFDLLQSETSVRGQWCQEPVGQEHLLGLDTVIWLQLQRL